jgi:cytochrome P450
MTDSDTDTEVPSAADQLFAPGTADDPHPTYARLRNECPVVTSDMGGFGVTMISRYEDVLAAFRSPERFTSAAGQLGLGEQPLLPLEVDPPIHSSYRRLLNPHFVPRQIELLEPEVRRVVTELIDGFVDRGSCDIHADLATPLPSSIFMALMGLPTEDLDMFFQWRDNTIRPDVEPGDFEGAQRIRDETATAISDYFRAAIAERRSEPDGSLLSELVHGEVAGRPLDEAELLGISHLLLLGGLDTVTATLDCMIDYLATHPEHRRELVDDPSLIPAAVEELLRFLTPVMVIPRTAAVDQQLCGVDIAAQAGVVLVVGAANTDEEVFGPPGVDFHREQNKHLAFGAGHHLCLGAHLARLELRVTLEELHRRIPDYRLAEGSEVHYSPGIRQADPLLVEWDVPSP